MIRVSIERLAWLIRDESDDMTLSALAEKYGYPVERISDAIDVLKIRCGESTTVPPVDWGTRSGRSRPDMPPEAPRFAGDGPRD